MTNKDAALILRNQAIIMRALMRLMPVRGFGLMNGLNDAANEALARSKDLEEFDRLDEGVES